MALSGSWRDGGIYAGLTLQYSEVLPGLGSAEPVRALISLTGSRGATSWLWSHATSDGNPENKSAMHLSSSHALTLYDPAPAYPLEPKNIVLNPGGVSEFKGVLRVGEHGDISMGEFRHRPAGQ